MTDTEIIEETEYMMQLIHASILRYKKPSELFTILGSTILGVISIIAKEQGLKPEKETDKFLEYIFKLNYVHRAAAERMKTIN